MPTKKKQWTVELMKQMNWDLVWTNFWNCDKFVIDKNTYYNIQEQSVEALAFKEKICYWIGKNWIYLEKDWEVFENEQLLADVKDVFKDNTRHLFKDKYFANDFCSWEIYLYPKKMLDWSIKCQVLDSRTIQKKTDSLWNIVWYIQYNWTQIKNIPVDWLYNSIVRYDPQNPNYWKSLYKWIVYDAMSDTESSKRQFYFFKNNAVPWAIMMLDSNITDVEIIKKTEQAIKDKYQWSDNAHKIMIAGWVKDVKLLELSNKDLDLLWLRNFLVKKRGVVFKMDPRIIWFMSDSWADRSIKSVREEAKETLDNMSDILEENINAFYRQFINPKADFIIRLDNETFEDRNEIEENQRKDIERWIITINEIREERWLNKFEWEENADKPLVWSSMTLLSSVWEQRTV